MNPRLCEIGKKIRQYRKENGLTMKELATAIGYESDTMISYLEKGTRATTLLTYEKIAKALHRPVTVLLGYDSIPKFEYIEAVLFNELSEEDAATAVKFIKFLKKEATH